MIIDTSAVLAILFAEPEADHFIAAILGAEARRMSVAPTSWYFGGSMVDATNH